MALNTLYHPTLDRTIRGKPSTSTVQFRNLKYATIPGRWKESVINTKLPHDADDVYDATQFGPSCPFSRAAQAWDLTLVGNVTMPMEEGIQEPMDEFDCLQLNVTVPKDHLEKVAQGEQLPVFVWVHGGGLSFGSNNWPQYNLTRFVERSIEIGQPVIGVAINYRVGILGFLASSELGIDGNFGFKDQVLAFRWIRKHIAGFGGDPNRITASGESAGAISLSTLLCVDTGREALFEKVVIMSGDATLRKSRIRSWHDMMYQDQLKFLGLDQVGSEQRKKQLREMDAMDMVKKLPMAQYYCACVDGRFLKKNISLDVMADGAQEEHKPAWCNEFVHGDTRHDGTVLHSRVLVLPSAFDNLKAACAKHLTTSETTALLSAYSLPASNVDVERRSMNELISDLRFYIPILAAQSGWRSTHSSERTFRYHFHVNNPVEGEFTGLASHELDVALLLGNYSAHLDITTNNVASQMTDQWIKYVSGEPWSELGKVVVVGTDGITQMSEQDYDVNFRGGNGKVLLSLGLEKCWRIAEAWQGVRAEAKEHGTNLGPFHLPGPLAGKITSKWLLYTFARGEQMNTVHYLHLKHGKIVQIGPREVSMSSAEAARVIYASNTPCTKGDIYKAMGRPSLFNFVDKEKHRERRRRVTHVFAAKVLAEMEPEFQGHAGRLVELIERAGGLPWDIVRPLKMLSLDTGVTTGEVLLGQSFNALGSDPPPHYVNLMKYLHPVFALDREVPRLMWLLRLIPFKSLQDICGVVDYIYGYGDARLRESVTRFGRQSRRRDLLTKLIVGDSEKGAEPLSDEEISVEVSHFIYAATDTTAVVMMYFLYEMAANLEWQTRLRKELAGENMRSKVCPYSVLQRLPVLQACVCETLRLHPPGAVGLPRVTPPEGLVIDGICIPGKITVSTPAFTIQRNPEAFPNPDSFDPARWLSPTGTISSTKRSSQNLSAYTFAPSPLMQAHMLVWGGGEHACAGQNMAVMEIKIMVARVLSQRRIRVASAQTHKDMEMRDHFVLEPRGGKGLFVFDREYGEDE
ncbi:hypothetical protein SLS60_005416 [Paraconiothyrium brasiliense]|uniref:Carboxylesterase type B domain-containing protein n=1 Tax=Paraconiothyrium brasiliense TaxID=300254 RepID=A0ABR3RHB3_9PLEO